MSLRAKSRRPALQAPIDVFAVGDADDKDHDVPRIHRVDDDIIPAGVNVAKFRTACQLLCPLAVRLVTQKVKPTDNSLLDVRGQVLEFTGGLGGEFYAIGQGS